MTFDTKIIDDFITPEEVKILEDHIMSTTTATPNWILGKIFAGNYHVFNYYDEENKIVRDILHKKLEDSLSKKIYIQQMHIFDCSDPYQIHTDIHSGRPFDPGAPENHAWTVIIPLETVDSHTIVFNEKSIEKPLEAYTASHPPFEKSSIDSETYNKYFTHVREDSFNWLTIENIFKWKKGSMFASDRAKYHCSDNFLANGLKSKKSIIAWTTVYD